MHSSSSGTQRSGHDFRILPNSLFAYNYDGNYPWCVYAVFAIVYGRGFFAVLVREVVHFDVN